MLELLKPIHQNDVQDFLNQSTQNGRVEIFDIKNLECANKAEIQKIAKKYNIDLKNNKDLVGFKNVYALTDKANLNKCRLPKEVMEKALKTIIGKPINIDHIRRYVIGHYLDAYIKGNKVYAYGVIYKSNFEEEWEEAKALFKKGKLTTSFEIYCPDDKKKKHSDGTFSLLSIDIAGGAILFKTKPAFKEAKVLELAKKHSEKFYKPDDMLFSNVKDENLLISSPITEEKTNEIPVQNSADYVDFKFKCFCKASSWKILEDKQDSTRIKCLICEREYKLKFKKEKNQPLSKYVQSTWQLKTPCPQCDRPIDFFIVSNEEQKNLECKYCGLKFKFAWSSLVQREIDEAILIEKLKDNTPNENNKEGGKRMLEIKKEDIVISKLFSKKLTYQQREKLTDDKFAVVKVIKNKKTGKSRKIRIFPIQDKAHVRNALARLAQEKVKKTLKDLGVSIESVKNKILKRAKELNMTDLLERQKSSVAILKENIVIARNKISNEKLYEAEVKKLEMIIENLEKENKLLKNNDKKLQKNLEDTTAFAELYEANAVKIIERRNIVGEFGKDLTDEDLLDDNKYDEACLKKKRVIATIKKQDNKKELVISSEEIIDIKKKLSKDISASALNKLKGGESNG